MGGEPEDNAGRRTGRARLTDGRMGHNWIGNNCMRAQIKVGPEAELKWRRDSEDAVHTGGPRYLKSDLAEVADNNLFGLQLQVVSDVGTGGEIWLGAPIIHDSG